MDAASRIRLSVEEVAKLRRAHHGDAALLAAMRWIKRWQNQRFSRTYADLSTDPNASQAVRFFLHELYSDADFSLRDQQFHRIAGAIGGLFPRKVAECAAALSELHGLTETFDDRMARALAGFCRAHEVELPEIRLNSECCVRYVQVWREVGTYEGRMHQLRAVGDVGRQLAEFTRTPGLRSMLRVMRGPALAGGLADLQHFLEAGFDTFADLSRTAGGAEAFLQTIQDRETELISNLFGESGSRSAEWLTERYGS